MSQISVRKASALADPDRAAVERRAVRVMDVLARQAARAVAHEPASVVNVGGRRIALSGFATAALLASDWYRPFATHEPVGHGRCLHVESRLSAEPLPVVEPSFAIASDLSGDVHRFVCERFGLVLDARSWRGSLFLNSEDLEAFDRSLRVATSLFCLESRAVLVHSCGIKYRGRGFLFVGKSGAGKSTLANLSSRYTVLSDETVLLDMARQVPLLHGTPFRGLSGRPHYVAEAAPLTAVLFLVQSPRNLLTPLDPAEAFRRLGSRAFVPAKAQTARAAALELVDEAAHAVPAFAMEFTKDATFLDLLDRRFCDEAAHA